MTQKIRKVVFPVGGMGTRFLPATKAVAKELLPVNNKPLIHYAFEEARDAGIDQFIFVTGRNKVAISNHFDHAYELEQALINAGKERELELTHGWLPDPGSVSFIRQQSPRGLGHAIWCARNAIGDEPFAVILADDLVRSETPCLKQLIDAFETRQDSNVVAVMDVPRNETNKYGVLDVQHEEGRIASACGMVEKPNPEDAPSTLSVIGRYILQPEIFDILQNQNEGAGGEIQLTDAISSAIPNIPMHGVRFEGQRFDCGNNLGFMQANLTYSMHDPKTGDKVREFMRDMLDEDAKGTLPLKQAV